MARYCKTDVTLSAAIKAALQSTAPDRPLAAAPGTAGPLPAAPVDVLPTAMLAGTAALSRPRATASDRLAAAVQVVARLWPSRPQPAPSKA